LLTEIQWSILNSMVDDIMEPLEEIAKDLRGKLPYLSADDFLQNIFFLYQQGFVTITQQPIPAFGQIFTEKTILPLSPQDVVGDLEWSFEEFYALRDYARKESIPSGSESAGVPFGIYVALTEVGHKEWDDRRYRCYYSDSEGNEKP
jgi:hypothetical protein